MARKRVTMQQDNDITFEGGFSAFLDNCKVKNLRPHTILYYKNVVAVWYKSCSSDMKLKDICSDTVNEFINYCSEAGQKNTTINTNLRGIRVILYYFMSLDWMDKFKINLIKADKEIIETYSKENIKVRQAEGIAVAKAKGVKLGRPNAQYPKGFSEVYNEWKSGNITAVKAFEKLGLKKATFYKLVKKYELEISEN